MSENPKIDLVNLEGTPGTQFTLQSALTHPRLSGSTGTITGIVTRTSDDPSLSDRDALTQYSGAFPGEWNGVRRHSVTAKAMSNGNIILIAKYKNPKSDGSSSGGGYSEPPRFEISHGQVNVRVYNDPENIDVLIEDGRYVQARLITVKWNDDNDRIPRRIQAPTKMDWGIRLNGTLNNNIVYPGGISFPPKTLKYIGPEGRYQNGVWNYMHVALGRVYFPTIDAKHVEYWKESYINKRRIGNVKEPKFRDVIPAQNW